jgi:hypothetical protein
MPLKVSPPLGTIRGRRPATPNARRSASLTQPVLLSLANQPILIPGHTK